MNSRERVFAALEFRTPDRAPRDLWTLPWVNQGAAKEFDALMKDFLFDFCWAGYLGKGDRSSGQCGRKGSYTDEWGCVWTAAEDGVVGEVKTAQLEEWSALDSFGPPWEVLERATPENINRTQEANLKSENPKFLISGSSVRLFERLQFLRGSENLYMDLAYDSAELRRLMDMVHEFYLKEVQGLAGADGDLIGFGDDWGSQKTLLISPAMWRHYFKPRYKQYCDIIRGAGKKVFFHSDGNISSIYPDLIEIGIDAVNMSVL